MSKLRTIALKDLDGLEPVHDKFRGVAGAFQQALEGIRNCLAVGVKVGLRFTLNKQNVADLPGIFDLIERVGLRLEDIRLWPGARPS